MESVYTEFQVPKEMVSYSYLYVEKGVSCINDVVRIRRKMLGMSRAELCRGICDVKTLARLENRKTVPQEEIVVALFERLGLPRELTRTELVTDEPEARELMVWLTRYINNHQLEKTGKLMTRIRELVPMDILCNQQLWCISIRENGSVPAVQLMAWTIKRRQYIPLADNKKQCI